MKVKCRKCGETKPIDQFTKRISEGPLEPWNVRKCKACTHVEYEKRYSDPEKREAQKAASRNWKERNLSRHAKLAREYRARNKEKITAQNRLNYAVRSGRLQRLPCEVCKTTERVHAHHLSYREEDWLNVRWLCQNCHELVHHMKA